MPTYTWISERWLYIHTTFASNWFMTQTQCIFSKKNACISAAPRKYVYSLISFLLFYFFKSSSTPQTPKVILQAFTGKGPYGFPVPFAGLWQLHVLPYCLLLLKRTSLSLIQPYKMQKTTYGQMSVPLFRMLYIFWSPLGLCHGKAISE